MPVTTKVIARTPGLLTGGSMQQRLNEFLAAEQTARTKAAQTATSASRAKFRYKRPANAPRRPGRSSTGGKFKTYLNWKPTATGGVAIDTKALDKNARHWIIQEIGTGGRATVKRGGSPNAKGRPKNGAAYIRTVRPQAGRRLSPGLVFATGPGGHYAPFGAGRKQQLYLRSKIKGAPAAPAPGHEVRIRREIKGQHFVQTGAEKGFRQYRTSVLSAARTAFRKRGGS
jgi:hypothetical protein